MTFSELKLFLHGFSLGLIIYLLTSGLQSAWRLEPTKGATGQHGKTSSFCDDTPVAQTRRRKHSVSRPMMFTRFVNIA